MSVLDISEFYKKSAELPKAYYNYFRSMASLARNFYIANTEATTAALKPVMSPGTRSIQDAEKARSTYNAELNQSLNQEAFATSVASAIDSWSNMMYHMDHNEYAKNLTDLFSTISRQLEPYRETINRTPSEVIEMPGRFNLLHYKSTAARKYKTPLLVVYSLINRHYILDLLPKYSIVNGFLNQGFDVYATDWGTPSSYDKDLTLENYANEYVGNAVTRIKEISDADKVSLFGYCWGGIFTLIYASLHPESVKNLILHATPVDIEKGQTTIEHWTSLLDADALVESCGNVPGWILNAAFLLRNPLEAVIKYPRYFSQPRTLEEIQQFFAIETWLYDSPPIIGEAYREIVNQIYKQNLLIKNQMRVGSNVINLKNVTMPVLDIVGKYDDLVPPQSSKSIIDAVGSSDKKLIEFPIGHVGLCISEEAHRKLWPEAEEWLALRSAPIAEQVKSMP